MEIAKASNSGNPEELAQVYKNIEHRKQVESEKEFNITDLLAINQIQDSYAPITGLPTAAPTTLGSLTEMGGHLAPDIALAAGTGGFGNVAKGAIIAGKMYTSSYGNKAYELYERGKQEAMAKGMDENAASQWAAVSATQNAATAAIPDAALIHFSLQVNYIVRLQIILLV